MVTTKTLPPISELWKSRDQELWLAALERYWEYVKPQNIELEREMGLLTPSLIRQMDARQWFDFLLHKYFPWKYTAPNRYTTTTRSLQQQANEQGLECLLEIRNQILDTASNNVSAGLNAAMQTKGLGPAGASGLLALLFPQKYGTIDQFAVKALRHIRELPEHELLMAMNPQGLTIVDGLILIQIMRRKANHLNEMFRVDTWTPRKIDMILWSSERV